MHEDSDDHELMAYAGNRYPQTAAYYAPGTDNDEYYAYCSAVQFLYIRSYREKETRRKIPLQFFPTCLRLESFGTVAAKVCDIMPASRYSNSTLAILGSKDGRVFAIQVEKSHDYKDTLLF